MSKPIATLVKFTQRAPNDVTNKFIREMRNNIPFDMDLAGKTNRVHVHRFVIALFSKYVFDLFKENGMFHQDGKIIVSIPVQGATFTVLTKVADLLYNGEVTVPNQILGNFKQCIEFLQVAGLQIGDNNNMPTSDPNFRRPMLPPPPPVQQNMMLNNPVNRRASIATFTPAKRMRSDNAIVADLPLNVVKTSTRSQPTVTPKAMPRRSMAQRLPPAPSPIKVSIPISVLDEVNKIAEADAAEVTNGVKIESTDSLNGSAVDVNGNKENQQDLDNINLERDEDFKKMMANMQAEVDLDNFD